MDYEILAAILGVCLTLWPAAGSKYSILLPFSQGEMDGCREEFLDADMSDPGSLMRPHHSTTARTDYAERICRGGMPLAVA